MVATTGNRSVSCPVLSPTEAVCIGNIPPSPERCLVPLICGSTRASLQGCGTGTSSLLRTQEKSLSLLLPGSDCGFVKLWLEGPGFLEKANMQVLGVNRKPCHSLCEEDTSQVRNRLMAPLGHLPIALNGEFDSFTMGIPKQGQGRKARQ